MQARAVGGHERRNLAIAADHPFCAPGVEGTTGWYRQRAGRFAGQGLKEVIMFERFKQYDWTFSATAETVVGALLALAIVVTVFSY